MSTSFRVITGILVALPVFQRLATAQPEMPDTSGSAAALLQCRAATKDLLASLKKTLQTELATGGPVRAVAVCADTAQVLSEDIGKKNGVQIRRVSDRWRNPLDTPDPFEREALKTFADALRETLLTNATEHSRVVVENGSRVFRYMKPIRVQGMCTACHGDPSRMDPALKEVIADRYPDDRATGYGIGDLRGAVSVRMPLSPSGER